MATLENPRRERFAQALARGKSQAVAYAEAGYAGGKDGASKLAQSAPLKAGVAERLAQMAPGGAVNIVLVVDDLLRVARKLEALDTAAGLTGARAALLAAVKLDAQAPKARPPWVRPLPKLDDETWPLTYNPTYLGNGVYKSDPQPL